MQVKRDIYITTYTRSQPVLHSRHPLTARMPTVRCIEKRRFRRRRSIDADLRVFGTTRVAHSI